MLENRSSNAFEIDSSSADSAVPVKNKDPWPKVWTSEMWLEKKKLYIWLTCKNGAIGCLTCKNAKSIKTSVDAFKDLSPEWIECNVKPSPNGNVKAQLSALRKKIKIHKDSHSHKIALEIEAQSKNNEIQKSINYQSLITDAATANVMRTAYFIAKNDRPHDDFPKIIELQHYNNTDVGKILHSRLSSTEMVKMISNEMRDVIVKDIIKNNSKIVVLVDESTSLGRKACMNIFLKTVVNGSEPFFLFLDLVELESKKADGLVQTILATLEKYGFSEDWLAINFIGFISDGANVLLGKHNGVAVQLQRKFPSIFILHCMSHRLELAVSDCAKSVKGIQQFIKFVGCIYTFYSMSPKNVRALSEICSELDIIMLKVGKVFDVRWVASSFKTVRAIWQNYEALYKHFDAESKVESRIATQKAKCKRIRLAMSSTSFVLNLGLLYDVLRELGDLSLDLQKRDSNLVSADKAIRRYISVLISMKDNPKECTIAARAAADSKSFRGVSLLQRKIIEIDYKQLIQALIDNLSSRLLENNEVVDKILECSKVLYTEFWPDEFDVRYGEKEVNFLCEKFKIDARESELGMREYVSNQNVIPKNLRLLKNCIDSLACGTAECERGFSAMNLIVTDLRTRLLVENVSDLLFIKINGPPVSKFSAEYFVKKWKETHRSANDNRSRKVVYKIKDDDVKKDKVYDLFKV